MIRSDTRVVYDRPRSHEEAMKCENEKLLLLDAGDRKFNVYEALNLVDVVVIPQHRYVGS
jgi:hypothetical protein